MVRTQIYITEQERMGLKCLAESTGKTQSELIREALDRYLELAAGQRRKQVLMRAAGIWKDRTDLPDFYALRSGWDRGVQ